MGQEQSVLLGSLVAAAAIASIWWRRSSWRSAAVLTLLLLSFGLIAAYGALSALPLPQTMFLVAILAVAYSAALEIRRRGAVAPCVDQCGNDGRLRRAVRVQRDRERADQVGAGDVLVFPAALRLTGRKRH